MEKFLSGAEFRRAIKRIVRGSQVRCAVAFWGSGAAMALFPTIRRAAAGPKIICDLSMGATCPDEIELLGGPNNDKIMHYPGLHAKVYLSDLGVVIGSANASSNGIGWTAEGSAKLLEAGTFHEVNSPIWTAASQWFDKTYLDSKMIDDTALDIAKKKWTRRLSEDNMAFPARQGSLLDMVLRSPGRFPNVGFVFTQYQNDAASVADVKKKAAAGASEKFAEAIMNWPIKDVFTNWKKGDIDLWPRIFVGLHKSPGARLYVSANRGDHFFKDEPGAVFCSGAWLQFKRSVGLDLPSQAKINTKDAPVVKHILSKTGAYGGKLFPNALALKEALEATPPKVLRDWDTAI